MQYLCLQRNPQKGADISRNCFLDKNTVSKQLSELQLLGYVSTVNEKGRDKYYEINEPLLRMCIEINEDRNGIIKLFVNFLGQLYSAEQLKEKYLHFNYLERFQEELDLIKVHFALKETDEALSSIEILFSKPERLSFIAKLEDALILLVKVNSEEAVNEVFNKLFQICKVNKANEKLSVLLSNVVFRVLRESQEIKPFRIEMLQHIVEDLFKGKPEFTYPLRFLNIGIRYFMKGEKEAIYEMSQEERVIFEKFTSTETNHQREKLNIKPPSQEAIKSF